MHKHSIINLKQSILHNSLTATISYTNLNLQILKLLVKEGLLTHYKKVFKNEKYYYRAFLRYYGSNNAIKDLKVLRKTRKNTTNNSKEMTYKKQSLLLSTSNGFSLQSNIKNYSIGGSVFFFINC